MRSRSVTMARARVDVVTAAGEAVRLFGRDECAQRADPRVLRTRPCLAPSSHGALPPCNSAAGGPHRELTITIQYINDYD